MPSARVEAHAAAIIPMLTARVSWDLAPAAIRALVPSLSPCRVQLELELSTGAPVSVRLSHPRPMALHPTALGIESGAVALAETANGWTQLSLGTAFIVLFDSEDRFRYARCGALEACGGGRYRLLSAALDRRSA